MKVSVVPMTEVRPLERNPRKHPEAQIQALQSSYEQFGQYRPLVVDESGEILVGNGLYFAMERAGAKEVSVYRAVGLSSEQRTKLILADNKTGAMSYDDFDVVEEMIRELSEYDIPGFDPETLAELMADAEETIEAAGNYGKVSVEDFEAFQRDAESAQQEREGFTVGAVLPPLPKDESGIEGDVLPNEAAPVSTVSVSGDVDHGTNVVCPECGHEFRV